jgi:ubiquinone/menaquinone biosynthesis C-methylase UbiE
MKATTQKRFALPRMEGPMARWYTQQRGSASQLELYREQAAKLTDGLPEGADVLEVAPGPGYLTIEIARLHRFHVTGLDISHTFVDIATRHARQAQVDIDFQHGDVQKMPFPAGSFDLIVCQAAFKNFGEPVTALNEMHRVLRRGGVAVIQDMSRDATPQAIAADVQRMGASPVNAFIVKRVLGMLRLRAASRARFESLAAASAFGGCEILVDGITMQVRLTKPDAQGAADAHPGPS